MYYHNTVYHVHLQNGQNIGLTTMENPHYLQEIDPKKDGVEKVRVNSLPLVNRVGNKTIDFKFVDVSKLVHKRLESQYLAEILDWGQFEA